MTRRLYITKATDAGNCCVDLVFNDKTTQRVDIGAFIQAHPHPQYNKYLDPTMFATFTIEDGNVVWGRAWDLIFPIDQLHRGKIEW